MEDCRAACILTGVDYSKAFKRLKHGPCLAAFADKGATTEMIAVLASFMRGKRITIKVGQVWSEPRAVSTLHERKKNYH